MLYFLTKCRFFEKGGAHAPVAPPLATALRTSSERLENLMQCVHPAMKRNSTTSAILSLKKMIFFPSLFQIHPAEYVTTIHGFV